ncbi:MAG: AI-2E family transporter [Micrococcales bacterium]|nr:AI-2E family transporter [Micrococcales bacterium]
MAHTSPADGEAREQTAPRWLRNTAGVSWRLLVVVFAVGLVFYALSKVLLVVIAVFLAFVITAILRPVVNLLDRIMPRVLAVGLSLLLGIALIAGVITYVVYSVANQLTSLSGQFGQGIAQITHWLTSGHLPFTLTNDQLTAWINQGTQWVQGHAGQIASQAAASAGSAVQVFTAVIIAVFCAVFFLARGAEMWTWFLNQLPVRVRKSWITAGVAGWTSFSGYTRGTVIIAVTDGILAFIWLTILRVPLAAPLAVLVLLGAFVPLVGAPAMMLVSIIVALATRGFVVALLVALGITLIGQFEGHFLQPIVMGHQVSLHPIVIALTVAGGGLAAGIFGAVVAVPLVSVTWAVFSHLRTKPPSMSTVEVDTATGAIPLVLGSPPDDED